MTTGRGVRTGPSEAEVARTALALWPAATLLLRGPAGRGSWTVDVEEGEQGRPVLALDPSAPVTSVLRAGGVGLLAVPVEGVVAGGAGWTQLRLTARFAPVRGASTDGRARSRCDLLAVTLVGVARHRVDPAAFLAAAPDPLRHSAAHVVDHLAAAHADELLACLRAQGHDGVRTVVPRAVDRYGLTLACLDVDGVRTVRLPFPGGPVADGAGPEAGWAVPLRCACGARRA